LIASHDPLFQEQAMVEEVRKVGQDMFLLNLKVSEIALTAKPGQFLELQVSSINSLDPLLRRPISIYSIDQTKGIIGIVYREVGRGTKLLSQYQNGDIIDVIGPIGNGFTIPDDAKKILLVAGGIGMPPLHSVAQYYKDREFILYYGTRSKDEVILEDEWKLMGVETKVATDDGSLGFHGRVTDLLKAELPEADLCCACGPRPMLIALKDYLKVHDIPGLISLEEKMACGVGACLGCVCKTHQGYRRVCVDGPVFAVEEVILDE
jgi:dihydroorotate dehydrogenase electron transfer subunit